MLTVIQPFDCSTGRGETGIAVKDGLNVRGDMTAVITDFMTTMVIVAMVFFAVTIRHGSTRLDQHRLFV